MNEFLTLTLLGLLVSLSLLVSRRRMNETETGFFSMRKTCRRTRAK